MKKRLMTYAKIGFLFIWCGFLVTAQATEPAQTGLTSQAIESALSFANTLTLSGRHAEARQACLALIEKAPSSERAFLCVGNAWLGSGDHREAFRAYATAYFLGAGEVGLPEQIAELAYGLGETHDSLRWYERAYPSSATNRPPEVRLRIAELRVANNDLDVAAADLEVLTTISDDAIAGKALLLLGRIAAQREQVAAAIGYFRQGFEKGQAPPDAVAYVVAQLINQKKSEEAADLLERHQMILPFDPVRVRSLVFALLRDRHYARAERHLLDYLEHCGLDVTAKTLISQLP